MDKVITQGSTIQCVDGGTVAPVSSSISQVLTVDGNGVLVDSLVGSTIPDCPVKPNTQTGTTTCLNVLKQSPGASKVLTVDGKAVLLFSDNGTTDGLAAAAGPYRTWKVNDAGQTFFTAD
jgi:hypothetical protein